MTPEQIIETFDNQPDISFHDLARITGWTVFELETLLLSPV